MNKRIGIVINSSWNIYNFRQGIVKHFLQNGYEVHAIAPKDEFSDCLAQMGCTFHETPISSRGNNPLQDLAYAYRLYRLYKTLDLGLVLHYTIKPNIYGTFSAHLAGIPCINNVTGLGTVFLNKDWISKISIWMYRFMFRYPSLVFFQNADDRKVFLDHKLIRQYRTELIPGSGVDLERHCPSPRPKNTAFTFLMVSRLLFDKGILEYLQAAKKLQQQGINCHFQLLGNVDHSGKFGLSKVEIDYWEQEGVVKYLGTSKDVRPYLDQADCVVLPSYREGTPRALLEAASHAKPLVATRVAGCKEVVQNGFNGLLCEVKNVDSLAEKMKEMALMPESRLQEMGNNSRRLAEAVFDEKIVVAQYARAARRVGAITQVDPVNEDAVSYTLYPQFISSGS